MKNGKRLIAGLLAAVMMISSAQFPYGTVYAAENEVFENETAAGETETISEGNQIETAEEQDAWAETAAEEQGAWADTVVEEQTAAAEVSEDADNDADNADNTTVEIVENVTEDNGEDEIITGEETTIANDEVVSDEETVVSEETTVDSEETTEQVSEEGTVETETEELDADLTADDSADYSAVEKYVHDQLLEKFNKNPKAETITVDVSSYKIPLKSSEDSKKLENIYCMYLKSDLFFLKDKSMPTLDYPNGILMKLTYKIDAEDIRKEADEARKQAEIQKVIDEALSYVNESMSDFQKIVILHDWLALHCEYDASIDDHYTAYAALVNRKAACMGYSEAYKILLNQVGMECYLVHCESSKHMWNLVKLDGYYYHVDLAFASNTYKGEHRVLHSKLLESDEEVLSHGYHDWQVTTTTACNDSLIIKATSTLYDNASWTKRITTTLDEIYDIFDDKPETEVPKTHTITYVLNGGTNNSENPATYTEGTEVNFKDPTREGYQFDGWYLNADFTRKTVGLSKLCTNDYTIYAKWIEITTSETEETSEIEESKTETSSETEETSSETTDKIHTITYVLNGGINNNENPATYTEGTEVNFKDPTREGYQFDGWYLNADFTRKTVGLSNLCKKDYIIYAKWTEMSEESKTEETITEESKTEETETSETETEETETPETEPTTEEPKTETSETEIPKTFKVTFNTNGRGTAPNPYTDIEENSTITAPAAPTASGYRFDGWYKNAACTKTWDFDNDTVTKDTVLYAKWVYENNTLDAKDIADMVYTGSACKPEVSVYDEETLLKAGKDYQVKYYNNVNANVGGVLKSDTFNAALPYVEITGKGNYTGSVKVNFNILRANVSDATLKVTDRFVSSNKAKKPFSSIKMNKAMKQGVDFTLRLTASDGKELSGAVIPAGMDGMFTLEIIGMNNYEGAIERTIYVADKASFPKNEKFAANTVNVSGITDKVYTGKAITQDATLSYGGRTLVRGADYTVSYAKNVNKGTATMTFKGLNGFTGSFKKTFKITAANITSAEYDRDVTAVYSKAGVKPELRLTMNGKRLVSGKDYTLSYANNKKVGNGTVIVKGKGNYAGSLSVPMNIVKADLNDVTVKTTPVAYNAKKAANYAYKPTVKLMDGKAALRVGVDYNIEYRNNTQAEYDACRTGRMSSPCAVITAKEGSEYKLDGELVIPLPIYQNKFTKNNVSVKVEQSECVYTGRQVKPSVEVRYMGALLTEGRDYTVSYGENKVSGRNKGNVTISGIGPNYGGDVVVKFEIYRKPIQY